MYFSFYLERIELTLMLLAALQILPQILFDILQNLKNFRQMNIKLLSKVVRTFAGSSLQDAQPFALEC